jgi:hypothetical protein
MSAPAHVLQHSKSAAEASANPSYSAGLEFELTGVAQGVELA